MALLFACLASLCFGAALVTAKFGLRSIDARAGAAISIPTATVLFALAAPFAVDAAGYTLAAVALFAAVGMFFPALVTLLTFASNEREGPTVTGAVSGTAPLFALPAAALFLGETISGKAWLAAAGVALGIALLSWPSTHRPRSLPLLALAGALLRGFAQAAAKAGLALWPNPFAASLAGYVVSSAVVVTADRVRQGTRADAGARAWFMATGVLNGAAVLLMYMALQAAPVSLVSPIVATYPLVAAAISAVVLRDERLGTARVAGAVVLVASIGYLVAG